MPFVCPPHEPAFDDGNSPPRHKERDKGKSGAGTKDCTMGLGTQKHQFPRHRLGVLTDDLGIEVLWCDACGCSVSHTTKSKVQGHLDCKKHPTAVEAMKNREKAPVERRQEAKAKAKAVPHKHPMRQPSLPLVHARRPNLDLA